MAHASTGHQEPFRQENTRWRIMPGLAILTALVIAICAAVTAPLQTHGPTSEQDVYDNFDWAFMGPR